MELSIRRCPITDLYIRENDVGTLGKGSYAEVYITKNILNKAKYAVKHYLRSRSNSTIEADMRVEFDIISSLDHPNIVCLVDAFINSDNCYLIFELCLGGELFEEIISNSGFTEPKCKIIIKQIMEGVQYLHSRGVIHRDLKPENILYKTIKDDSILKITDFGVSKLFDSKFPDTEFTSFIASKYYVAPEVLVKPSSYTKEIDCWSVGVIGHILLVGYPPYDGKTIGEVYIKIRDHKLVYHKKDWLSRSKECFFFIKELLKRDPKKRMKSRKALMHSWLSDVYLQKYSTAHIARGSSSANSLSLSFPVSIDNEETKNITRCKIKYDKQPLDPCTISSYAK